VRSENINRRTASDDFEDTLVGLKHAGNQCKSNFVIIIYIKMKKLPNHLSIIALALTGFMIASCGNHNASATGNIADAAPSANENSTFSYKIDGQPYSWTGNDHYANQAIIDSNNEVFFTLMSNDPTEKNPPQFGFGIGAVGPTTINWENMDRFKSSRSNGGNHFANFKLSFPNENAKYPDYEFGRTSTVTVVITSKNETRITGTFSGELVNVATQKPSQLTDGKFDLPLRKQKK
jgi:hypothetical protein